MFLTAFSTCSCIRLKSALESTDGKEATRFRESELVLMLALKSCSFKVADSFEFRFDQLVRPATLFIVHQSLFCVAVCYLEFLDGSSLDGVNGGRRSFVGNKYENVFACLSPERLYSAPLFQCFIFFLTYFYNIS